MRSTISSVTAWILAARSIWRCSNIDSGLRGVQFIAANTDLQALDKCRAPVKMQIGGVLTKGLGAGADPQVGRKAAIEDTVTGHLSTWSGNPSAGE